MTRPAARERKSAPRCTGAPTRPRAVANRHGAGRTTGRWLLLRWRPRLLDRPDTLGPDGPRAIADRTSVFRPLYRGYTTRVEHRERDIGIMALGQLAASQSAEDELRLARILIPTSFVPLARRTAVLVVEDDGDLREMYRHTLQFSGYAVEAVGDGLSALRQIINGNPPDLVVLDLALPSLGGRDVRREMISRAGTRDIPVVVVTGTDARDLSASDYPCVLHKPIEPEALVSAVDNCLKRPR